MNYRDFKPRFLHFVISVKKESQKLEWLISSVTGEAHNLISKLDLVDSNYAIALARLDERYLNSDFVKENLLKKVLEFKIDPKIPFIKVPSVITSLTNMLDTLKETHKIDCYERAGMELVRCILFHKLPEKIKKNLIYKLIKIIQL